MSDLRLRFTTWPMKLSSLLENTCWPESTWATPPCVLRLRSAILKRVCSMRKQAGIKQHRDARTRQSLLVTSCASSQSSTKPANSTRQNNFSRRRLNFTTIKLSETQSSAGGVIASNLMLQPDAVYHLAFRDSKWYAHPVTLRNPALIQCSHRN